MGLLTNLFNIAPLTRYDKEIPLQEEIKEKKFKRTVTVTFVDKSIPQEVFDDVDEVSFGTVWVTVTIRKKKRVSFYNKHLLKIEKEWMEVE